MKKELIEAIKAEYPNPTCELKFSSPFELLVAVILSAQCTDKRVNEVTKELFKVASTPQDFVKMPLKELEQHIFSCGFYHNKAKAIKEAATDIVEKFGSNLPSTMEELKSLSGVGTKTASVVLSMAFKRPALAVDTHVFRVSNRLGVAEAKTADEMHKKLLVAVPKDFWIDYHYSIVLHGRYICKSQKPACDKCALSKYCQYYKKEKKGVC